MQRQPVTSSNLKSVGYDAARSLLEVEFTDGGVYQYHGVPAGVYDGLMAAGSHGSYFAAHIRTSFHYVKVG
jgi:hypothetical protein